VSCPGRTEEKWRSDTHASSCLKKATWFYSGLRELLLLSQLLMHKIGHGSPTTSSRNYLLWCPTLVKKSETKTGWTDIGKWEGNWDKIRRACGVMDRAIRWTLYLHFALIVQLVS
jgi:hypothetical protein